MGNSQGPGHQLRPSEATVPAPVTGVHPLEGRCALEGGRPRKQLARVWPFQGGR